MTWTYHPWEHHRAFRYDSTVTQPPLQPPLPDIMASPEQADSLRENLRQVILEQLTDALLDWPAMASLSNPVLRVEAFIQDGNANVPGNNAMQSPLVTKMVDLSGYMTPSAVHPSPTTAFPPGPSGLMSNHIVPSQAHLVQHGDPTIQQTPMDITPLHAPMYTTMAQPPHHQQQHQQHHQQLQQHPHHQQTSPPSSVSSHMTTPSHLTMSSSSMALSRRPSYQLSSDDDAHSIGIAPRPSTLRPVRAGGPSGASIQEGPDSQRQMQIAGHFPKRAKIHNDPVTFMPQPSSLDKFIISVWDQIHGGINLEPQVLLEQWQLAAAAATATINGATTMQGQQSQQQQAQQHGQLNQYQQLEFGGIMSPPLSEPHDPSSSTSLTTGLGLALAPNTGNTHMDLHTFNRSNLFCRKVTQASRACRSIEVIVQARWIEHFDAHVELLAVTSPSMSPTKRRKAALLEACGDFGWSEKELRNKMAIWRGYKEIKDAGGWAALVFAGMGLYRFCKYRVGFTPEAMARLRSLRPRIEVAADTLHPTWRQLLVIVGESPQRRFCGHPHDWVVRQDGSDPVPLRSTYLEHDPFFSFEHLEGGSVVDADAWGPDDDPRWVPPPNAAACVTGAHVCHSCGQEQSEDPKANSCYCFPTLFGGGSGNTITSSSTTAGPGPASASASASGSGAGPSSSGTSPGIGARMRNSVPVQVFRTTDGRNNGLIALCPFERGAAIGEFVGLVTKDLHDLDVMDSSTGVRGYQIWQGRQGNFTRFVNHSCRPNAQFQHFVWLSTQRIVLVSKGIEAGAEITVDYSGSYWRGLDKKCLCGESCCRYKRQQ
ncbi:SET domain-containing protein [Plectosphaerella plurivora]|uniref:SET domain-containing protein n=1 Tax=Plectosphaerella plurivora TaxID=936078 RepID=A0A9P9A8K0_9PEZI|nr:SET domain-containing protein [Plectosphaerella plurivora]